MMNFNYGKLSLVMSDNIDLATYLNCSPLIILNKMLGNIGKDMISVSTLRKLKKNL